MAPVAVSATTRRVIKSAPGRAVSRGSGGVGECDGNPAFRRPRLTLASEGLRTGRTLEKSCPLNVCLAAQARLDSKWLKTDAQMIVWNKVEQRKKIWMTKRKMMKKKLLHLYTAQVNSAQLVMGQATR
nr:uncharacterized protein LOC123566800 [Macaca fascicularis]